MTCIPRISHYRRYAATLTMMLCFLAAARSDALNRTMYVMLNPVEAGAPSGETPSGVKVCLVVKDGRNKDAVNTQMCGVMRNGFGGAIGIWALANQEPLATIMAFNIADRLRSSGFDVVQVVPELPQTLSAEPRPKMKDMKDSVDAAKESQPKDERQEGRAIQETGPGVMPKEIAFRPATDKISAAGGAGWSKGADLIMEVTIDEFTTDTFMHAFTVEILGWSSVTIKIAPGENAKPGTTKLTDVQGWGRYNAGGASKASWKAAVNQTFGHLLDRVQAVIRSEAFANTTKTILQPSDPAAAQ